MKASKEQIEKALAYLKNERETLPEFSFFGDDNWEKIHEQKVVLTGALNGYLPDPEDHQADEDSTLYYLALWLYDTSDSDYGTEREIN
jgi:hypothetical protein